jgi:hypothetical protein
MQASTKLLCCAAAALGLSAGWSRQPAGAQSATPVRTDATYICRQAYADEAATARMVSNSATLVCRPIAVSMRMADGSMKIIGDVKAKPQPGPDFSKALTPGQVQEECTRWLETLFRISHTS